MRVLALQLRNFGSNITLIYKILNKEKGLGMTTVVMDQERERTPEDRVLSLALERLSLVAREKERQSEMSLVRINLVANNVDSSTDAVRS